MGDFEHFAAIAVGFILACALGAWLNANERRKK